MRIDVPTSWGGITLAQYIELLPILKMECNDVERTINILCVLLGKPKRDIEALSIDSYNEIKKHLAFLYEDSSNLQLPSRFRCKGRTYNVEVDVRKMTGGQYISVMELLKEVKENEMELYNNLPRILTTICKPIRRTITGWKEVKVDAFEYQDIADDFYNEMTMDIVLPIAVFFCSLWKRLTTNMEGSLIQKAEMKSREVAYMIGGG